jgi:colicin import membrane protein
MEEQRDQQRQDLAARQPSPQPAASPSEATPTPMAGNNGVDTSLRAAYVLAIQNAVERNWRRPETIPAGQRCRIVIVQIPGGEVISADVDPTCPYDALGRDSLERAVFAASPLPYAGFEDVFERRLGLNFQPAD